MTTADAAGSRRRDGLGRMHPLDLPPIIAPARRNYLLGLLLQEASSPRVLVGLCALLMIVSNNPITPLIGPWLCLTLVCYFARRLDSDAWAYIPRREQDTQRPAPSPWVETGALAQLAVLACGVSAYLAAARAEPEVQGGSIVAGLAAMLGVRELVLLMKRPEPRAQGSALRTFIVSAAAILSLITCLFAVIASLPQPDLPAFDAWGLAAGGLTLVTAVAVWQLLRLMPERVRCLPELSNES